MPCEASRPLNHAPAAYVPSTSTQLRILQALNQQVTAGNEAYDEVKRQAQASETELQEKLQLAQAAMVEQEAEGMAQARAELEALQEEMAGLKAQEAKAGEMVLEMTMELQALEGERERASEEHRLAMEVRATHEEELLAKLEGAKAFEATLTQEVDTQKELHASAEHAAAEARQQVEQLTEQLRTLGEENSKLEENKQSLGQDLDSLRKANEAFEREAVDQRLAVEKATGERDDLQEKLQSIQAKNKESEAALNKEIEQMKHSLQEAASSTDAAIQEEKASWGRERDTLQVEVEALRSELGCEKAGAEEERGRTAEVQDAAEKVPCMADAWSDAWWIHGDMHGRCMTTAQIAGG